MTSLGFLLKPIQKGYQLQRRGPPMVWFTEPLEAGRVNTGATVDAGTVTAQRRSLPLSGSQLGACASKIGPLKSVVFLLVSLHNHQEKGATNSQNHPVANSEFRE